MFGTTHCISVPVRPVVARMACVHPPPDVGSFVVVGVDFCPLVCSTIMLLIRDLFQATHGIFDFHTQVKFQDC